MSDAPAQGFKTIRQLLPKSLQPFARGLRKRFIRPRLQDPYRSVFPYTQAHATRQENLVRLAGIVEQNNIPGAVVECGVLDGGTAALMAWATKERPVHLFDSWEGLPATTEEDGNSAMWSGQVVGSPKRVISIMRTLSVDPARLHFHKGWFSDTFSSARIDNIALLHVDGDFYQSVKLTLETWGPKVSTGGFIQIDDYDSFVGCRRAVDEYLAEHPSLELQFVENQAKAWFIEV